MVGVCEVRPTSVTLFVDILSMYLRSRIDTVVIAWVSLIGLLPFVRATSVCPVSRSVSTKVAMEHMDPLLAGAAGCQAALRPLMVQRLLCSRCRGRET